MTPEEKNKIIFGQRYVASTIIEKEVKTADGKTETVVEDSEETLNLWPIKLGNFKELDAADPTDFENLLIAFSARKPIEWVDNTLNSAQKTNIVKICKEINVGFFEWRARTVEKIKTLGQERMELLETLKGLPSLSQTTLPKPQTDTVSQ